MWVSGAACLPATDTATELCTEAERILAELEAKLSAGQTINLHQRTSMCWLIRITASVISFLLSIDPITVFTCKSHLGGNFHQWFLDASTAYEATFSNSPWMIPSCGCRLASLPASNKKVTLAISDPILWMNNSMFWFQMKTTDSELFVINRNQQLSQ